MESMSRAEEQQERREREQNYTFARARSFTPSGILSPKDGHS